ncbi:MAG TPA: RnfABCDGE type electron transport complex subunit B [Burkholderiales bacterium]|nr:RnfABCDGE type electron transport complex subunit B [Burkholderiales bacterium]
MSATQPLADRIDAWLPQTQCTRCGYPRCRDYADAVADGRADINRCPPGGETTLNALAGLLDVTVKALDPACGTHEMRTRAVIDEAVCIGCRKCIDACPVDAIVGAGKLMHTVIAAECNGCGLCVPPCPVDCIAMAPNATDDSTPWSEYSIEEAGRWRMRTYAKLQRLERRKRKPHRGADRGTKEESIFPNRETIRADIRAAMERVKRKKALRIKPAG